MSLGNWSPVRSRCRRSRFFQVWMTCERSNASATTTAADGFNLPPPLALFFLASYRGSVRTFLPFQMPELPWWISCKFTFWATPIDQGKGFPSHETRHLTCARPCDSPKSIHANWYSHQEGHSQPSGTARLMGPTSLREAMPCRLAQPLSAGPHNKEGRT